MAPRSPGPVPPAAAFPITFWCGPPHHEFDAARAAQIAAAGFTLIGPPCEGPTSPQSNRAVLDIAAAHGLHVLVEDERLSLAAERSEGWEDRAHAAVAEYRGHPGLGGYLLVDEPTTDDFPALAQLVALLHGADPGALAYINLAPNFVSTKDLGAPTYTEYVRTFVAQVQPALLSYDYYPFRNDGDRPGFFDNLRIIRDAAAAAHLPFMLIVQAMPHGPYRDVTEAELSWQLFNALAFGAQGLSYFAYWTPVHVNDAERMRFHQGLIENGEPTRHYFEAQRLNRKVEAIAAQLIGFRSVAVADSSGVIAAPLPLGPIDAVEGGPVTVGLFAGAGGRFAALLVNRDYRYAIDVRVRLRPGTSVPELFDAATENWDPGTTFTLPPGGARLLRWPAQDAMAHRQGRLAGSLCMAHHPARVHNKMVGDARPTAPCCYVAPRFTGRPLPAG